MKFIVSIIVIYGVATAGAYFVGPTWLEWAEAEAYCNSQGSNLASMHSQNDFNEVVALCDATGDPTGCHIGATLDSYPGEWKWSDDSATNFGFINGNGAQLDLNIWNTGDMAGKQHCSYMYRGSREWQFEDIDCANRNDNWGMNPAICNGNGPCDSGMIGVSCNNDAGCPDCMQCCPRENKCEYPPEFAKTILSNKLQLPDIEVNPKNIGNDPDYITPVAKNNYNYYGYIVLIGVIAFILINNVFIGYWCVTKKTGDYKFEKVVVE
eukprot:889557_1